MEAGSRMRPIRSYVLRQGRVSNAQQRACDTLLPRYGIVFRDVLLDLDTLFGRTADKVLEIGFGMGETTASIAAAHPEHDYVGIEVHTPGVGSLLRLIEERGLSNRAGDSARRGRGASPHDPVGVAFRGPHLLPRPVAKARHHKRRLIQGPFVTMVVERLKPGGYLHIATDWESYARQVLAVLSAEPRLANTAEGFATRPDHRPMTKFEQRGLKLGHGVWDVLFRRV